jgi:hypothetical protein
MPVTFSLKHRRKMNLLLTELAEAHELEKPPPTDGNGSLLLLCQVLSSHLLEALKLDT